MATWLHQAPGRLLREMRERRGNATQEAWTRVLNEARASVASEDDEPKPLDQVTVSRIENGRRVVSLQEWLELAAGLGVAPLHLLVPWDDDEPVRIGRFQTTARQARDWIRGDAPLPGTDEAAYWSEQPSLVLRQRERSVTERLLREAREWYAQVGAEYANAQMGRAIAAQRLADVQASGGPEAVEDARRRLDQATADEQRALHRAGEIAGRVARLEAALIAEET